MSGRLRWGIVGTSGLNDRIVGAIRASEHGEIVAIGSRLLPIRIRNGITSPR